MKIEEMTVITIEEDGWVWIRYKDGTEIGLGDIDTDVVINNNK